MVSFLILCANISFLKLVILSIIFSYGRVNPTVTMIDSTRIILEITFFVGRFLGVKYQNPNMGANYFGDGTWQYTTAIT